jgi:putative redox protein
VNTVHVRWVDKRQFTGWNELGHGIVMDAPAQFKGEGTGPRPIELVLYGLGGCTAMDVVSVLQKKRLDVRGVEVTVSGTQREDGFPHYYETIEIAYEVTGVGITEAAVARAIELSEDKYCAVKGMFGPQVSVSTSFRVLAPGSPGPAAPDAE